jgi:hypothetical protein
MIATPNSIGGWAIWIIVACGVIGIAYIVVGVTGVVIPAFIITIGWVLIAVILGCPGDPVPHEDFPVALSESLDVLPRISSRHGRCLRGGLERGRRKTVSHPVR